MPYYEVVNPMNGKREQVRPVNEIAAEMDALDGQIAELSRQRDALAYEHEATANLLNYGLPKVF